MIRIWLLSLKIQIWLNVILSIASVYFLSFLFLDATAGRTEKCSGPHAAHDPQFSHLWPNQSLLIYKKIQFTNQRGYFSTGRVQQENLFSNEK